MAADTLSETTASSRPAGADGGGLAQRPASSWARATGEHILGAEAAKAGSSGRSGPVGGYKQTPVYHNTAARIVGALFTAVWLIYLIQPAATLVSHHYQMWYRVTGLAIIGVFCLGYVVAVPNWTSSPRYALPTLAGLTALAAAGCVWFGGMGMETLWIFVSSASGLLIPVPRRAVAVVLAVSSSYVIFSIISHVSRSDLLINLLPTIFIGLAMIGFRRQFYLTVELRMAREEVAQLAANQERLRLARDMHDLTGQSLSSITLKSELAAKLLGRLPDSPERNRIRDEMEQVAAVSRQTLQDIREAISGYRRPTLAIEAITGRAALESAAITAQEDSALTMLSGTFDPEAEAALAWCLREAVTNVIRHSGADTCYITLTRHAGTMSLEVRDDGSGHTGSGHMGSGHSGGADDPQGHGQEGHGQERLADLTRTTQGSGLRGMSERLRAVGGALQLRPHSSPGFSLTATVPLNPPATSPGSPNNPTSSARPTPAASPAASARLAHPTRTTSPTDRAHTTSPTDPVPAAPPGLRRKILDL